MKAFVFLAILFCTSLSFAKLPVEITTSPEDTEYLRGVMKDTFDWIYYYRHPVTGFCSYVPEKPNPAELMKTENIFLSLASVGIAGKIGLLPEDTARREIAKTLSWIEKIPKAQGFVMDSVHTADGSAGNQTVYAVGDLGFNSCSLLVLSEAYPEFKERIRKLVEPINWSLLYNEKTGGLYGIVKLDTGEKVETIGSAKLIASDQRPGMFMTIATAGAPASLWRSLPRNYLKRYGVKYLKPGEGLGYGELTWAMGYFLDERGSDIGMSDANMAWAQINYAADMDYPFWGWSNCLGPKGYMGFGDPGTNWSILNPHAVAAAVSMYPNQVVKALRAMEKAGVRNPMQAGDLKFHNFGFCGGIDIDTGETPRQGTCLDQAIIFLSLANYLHDGIVWKYFEQSPEAVKGVSLIKEYSKPKMDNLKLYRERDMKGPSLKKKTQVNDGGSFYMDSFNGNDINDLNGQRSVISSFMSISGGVCEITFGELNQDKCAFVENLAGADINGYNAVTLWARGDKKGQFVLTLRVSGEGGYRPIRVSESWREVTVPLRSFLGGKTGFNFEADNPELRWTGMWHDRGSADELELRPVDVQKLFVKNIRFVRLSRSELSAAAAKLAEIPKSEIESDGTFDRLERADNWKTMASGYETKVNLTNEKGFRDNALACAFNIGAKGGWMLLYRDFVADLKGGKAISFRMKVEGGPATLEVKIIDASGATYIKAFPGAVSGAQWREFIVKVSDIGYGWGGVRGQNPANAEQFQIGIVSDNQTSGKLWLDDLRLVQSK